MMCSSPKSRRSQAVSRSSGSIFGASSDVLDRYTARANTAYERRQILKALQAEQEASGAYLKHKSAVPQKTGWRYWLFKADLVSIVSQHVFGEKISREPA